MIRNVHTVQKPIKQMSQDVRINTLINQEKLKVVAVSPVEDINKWKAYQTNIPTKWINGFDKSRI